MDEPSSWTPGEVPEPPRPEAAAWRAPATPGRPDALGSGWGAPPGPASSSAGSSPYAPPEAASPYAPPADPSFAPGGYPPPAPGATPYGPPIPAGVPGPGYGAAPFPMAAPYPYPYADAGGTESLATAAMIVGIASLFAPFVGPITAIVLGVVALNRIKATGRAGRGRARAGIIFGVAWLIVPLVAAVAMPVILNERQATLHRECASGDMGACDQLFDATRAGTAEHHFADTCGGRTQGGYRCTAVGAVSYGDDRQLDALWDACSAGDAASCDDLYAQAPPGSDYSRYGMTCGNRSDGSTDCVDALRGWSSST